MRRKTGGAHWMASAKGPAMNRKILVLALTTAFLLFVHAASAQGTKVHKVGVLLQGGSWYAMVDGLRHGLKDLGFVEGKQYILDIRDGQGDLKEVERAARNFEEQKVSLIYTVATSVSLAAKDATATIPIVFVAGSDPVVVKLVKSFAAPGGRLTGVLYPATDLTGKRLELLREIVPNLRRVVTFYNPSNRSAVESAKQGRQAAQLLGLQFIERHVASVEDLEKAVQAFRSNEADAYFSVSDAMIDNKIESIIEMGRVNKLPTMFYDPVAVAKGGLATYSGDFYEAGRLSAKYVQQILAGTNPADLAVERIDKLLFVINLKTAKQIGLSVPESVLARADRVID